MCEGMSALLMPMSVSGMAMVKVQVWMPGFSPKGSVPQEEWRLIDAISSSVRRMGSGRVTLWLAFTAPMQLNSKFQYSSLVGVFRKNSTQLSFATGLKFLQFSAKIPFSLTTK